MEFLKYMLVPVIISFVNYLIFLLADKEKNHKIIESLSLNEVEVRQPKILFWIGSIGFLFGTIYFFIIVREVLYHRWEFRESICFFALAILFMLMSLALIIDSFTFKITVYRTEGYFVYRAFIKKRKIYCKDCLSFKIGNQSLKIKTVDKTINVNLYTTNVEFLVAMLQVNKVKEIE